MKKTLLILCIGLSVAASAQKKRGPLKYWEEFSEKEKTAVLKDFGGNRKV